jgi:hypothetical protein
LAEDIHAWHTSAGLLNQAGVSRKVLCQYTVNHHEWRTGVAISVMTVTIQRFDVQGLVLPRQLQDELVAGEGIRHLGDDGRVAGVQWAKIVCGHGFNSPRCFSHSEGRFSFLLSGVLSGIIQENIQVTTLF